METCKEYLESLVGDEDHDPVPITILLNPTLTLVQCIIKLLHSCQYTILPQISARIYPDKLSETSIVID